MSTYHTLTLYLAFNANTGLRIACDGRGKNSESTGARDDRSTTDISRICTIYYVAPKEKEREKKKGEERKRHRVDRLALVNSIRNSQISRFPLFFLVLHSVFSFLEKEPVFLIARANAFLLALHLPRPTHDGARKARRTQDEERVWHARADFSYKNGLNNTEIYLFSGINHRELYDSAYITQIGALYQSARQVCFSFALFPFFTFASISSCRDFFS